MSMGGITSTKDLENNVEVYYQSNRLWSAQLSMGWLYYAPFQKVLDHHRRGTERL